MNTAETFEVSVGVPSLADRTVVVTRPKAQAEELAEALEEYHQTSSSSGTTSLGELLKEQLDQGN